MGNAVAIIDRQNVVPAFTMSDMERIATSIAKGGMFGSKDPHAVLTLCMLAQAEGQHPAVVFRDYDIIQGKPAKKAEAMLRDFINSGGQVKWNRLDDECADATFSHPQGGEVTINWTMARAQKAQLGGKDMWKKYPRQMLRSRVVSEGVRTVCPNATSGLYVPEEVRDFDNAPANDTPATPEPKRARDLKPEQPKEIEAKPEDQARQKAESWVAKFIGNLAETDADGAADLFSKYADTIDKMRAEYPDLHERLMGYAPSGPDDGDSPQDPEQPDPDVNDEHPGKAKADAIIEEIRKAATVIDVNSIVSRHKNDLEAMHAFTAGRVTDAAIERKGELTPEPAK